MCPRLLEYPVFSQKLLIVETRLNAFSGNIDNVLSIKAILKQFMLIGKCNEQFFILIF